MKKKIKHISLKSLRKQAWKLQSEWIRRSEKGICFTCGVHQNWKEMETGHYIHKNCLDFVLMNLHCQCTRCNRFLHGNLGVYAERMIAEFGENAVAELRTLAGKEKKYNIFELEGLISCYKQRLKEMDSATLGAK